MADSKISALPASTTPLAGTEVLPIVQSSTTKKVAVSDLTAGRAVSASTLSLTSSGPVSVFNTGNTSSVRQQYTNSGGTFQVGLDSSGGAIFGVPYAAVVWHGANYPVVFGVNNAEVARFDTSGNLVPATAAKGINFTANTPAAGMTSQLLNWYEEGTWTPILTFATPGDLSVTYSTQVGRYTRIGRQVTVIASITTSAFTHTTASGNLNITGLPFTSANVTGLNTNGTVSAAGWTKTCEWIVPQIGNNSAVMYFQASTSGSALANVTSADVPTATQQVWRVALTYFV